MTKHLSYAVVTHGCQMNVHEKASGKPPERRGGSRTPHPITTKGTPMNVKTIEMIDGSSVTSTDVRFEGDWVIYIDKDGAENRVPMDKVKHVSPRGVMFDHGYDENTP